MDKAVRTVQPGEAGLEVVWETGEQTSYPWLWLRDHATDAQSYDPRSGQRELYTAGLDPDIRGLAARLGSDGHSVEIDWPDGPQSVAYDAGFLWRFRVPAPAAVASDRRQPWDRATGIIWITPRSLSSRRISKHSFFDMEKFRHSFSSTSGNRMMPEGVLASSESRWKKRP